MLLPRLNEQKIFISWAVVVAQLVVASNDRGLRFESRHKQIFIMNML